MGAVEKIFTSIGRFFRGMGYMLAGRIDQRTKGINEDPHVVRAEYDTIIEEKTRNVRQARDAVAGLMRHYEGKVAALENLREKIDRQERLMAGAKARAAKIAKNKNKEESQRDPEFIKCMKAYQDFKSTLEQMKERAADLENDSKDLEKQISNYEVQLQQLHRDLQKIREEREANVADVIMASKDRELQETLAGIGQDNTAERLQGLRGRVRQVRSEAKVTSKLAGTDTAAQEAEFLAEARASEAEEEFLHDLFGEDKKAVATAPAGEADARQQLPD